MRVYRVLQHVTVETVLANMVWATVVHARENVQVMKPKPVEVIGEMKYI